MKLTSIKNCGGADQVIKISQNSTAKLTKKCEVIPDTCIESKGFKTATVKYKIFKNNIPIMQGGPEDLCKQMQGSGTQIKGVLDMFGLPTSCPVEESQICSNGDKKLDITKNKSLLAMVRGKIRAHADIEHDSVS